MTNIKAQYADVLPRFLSAITGMATSRGTLNERVHSAVVDVIVLPDADIPKGIAGNFAELEALIDRTELPSGADSQWGRAYYMSDPDLDRAAALLVEMFETIVATVDGTSDA